MDRIWPKQLCVAKPYPIEQLLTKNEIKFFFSAFFFKPAKTIFSLRVRSFLFGLLFFWEFWKWRCTCVGILVRANQIQEFKFTSSLLLFWRSTHLASHWLIFSVRWRIISRREKNNLRKCPPPKPTGALFSMVTFLLARRNIGDNFKILVLVILVTNITVAHIWLEFIKIIWLAVANGLQTYPACSHIWLAVLSGL